MHRWNRTNILFSFYIFIQFILYYSPQIPCILSSFIYIFYGNLSFFYLLFISVSLFSATIKIPELLIQKKRRTQETSPPVSGASVCFYPLLCRYQLWLCCIFHSFVFACSAMTRAYHPPHLKSSQCVPLSDRFPSCKTRICIDDGIQLVRDNDDVFVSHKVSRVLLIFLPPGAYICKKRVFNCRHSLTMNLYCQQPVCPNYIRLNQGIFSSRCPYTCSA